MLPCCTPECKTRGTDSARERKSGGRVWQRDALFRLRCRGKLCVGDVPSGLPVPAASPLAPAALALWKSGGPEHRDGVARVSGGNSQVRRAPGLSPLGVSALPADPRVHSGPPPPCVLWLLGVGVGDSVTNAQPLPETPPPAGGSRGVGGLC